MNKNDGHIDKWILKTTEKCFDKCKINNDIGKMNFEAVF